MELRCELRRRISLNLNNEPERSQVLPPLDNDMRDIILIPKVSTSASLPAGHLEAGDRFWRQLASGLPTFLHDL
jgi:hypothetical protein